MDDLAEQLARRDRLRKRMATQRTPEERLRVFEQMQAAARDVLRNNPKGYAQFLKRNFAARAIDVRSNHAE